MWYKHLKFTIGVLLMITLILPFALVANYFLAKESQPFSEIIQHLVDGIRNMQEDIYY
jgi:hypothetical protein